MLCCLTRRKRPPASCSSRAYPARDSPGNPRWKPLAPGNPRKPDDRPTWPAFRFRVPRLSGRLQGLPPPKATHGRVHPVHIPHQIEWEVMGGSATQGSAQLPYHRVVGADVESCRPHWPLDQETDDRIVRSMRSAWRCTAMSAGRDRRLGSPWLMEAVTAFG